MPPHEAAVGHLVVVDVCEVIQLAVVVLFQQEGPGLGGTGIVELVVLVFLVLVVRLCCSVAGLGWAEGRRKWLMQGLVVHLR